MQEHIVILREQEEELLLSRSLGVWTQEMVDQYLRLKSRIARIVFYYG